MYSFGAEVYSAINIAKLLLVSHFMFRLLLGYPKEPLLQRRQQQKYPLGRSNLVRRNNNLHKHNEMIFQEHKQV